MAHVTVYIDEAGDEGFGKLRRAGGPGGQSQWLIMGACIVTAENDAKLPGWRDAIATKFPERRKRDLHFRDLKHDQKVVVCQEIARLPLGIALALSHKVTIPGSPFAKTFKQKQYLYNYLIRWLLERIIADVVAASGDEPASVKLVFSQRGGTDYHVMKRYLHKLRRGDELMPVARPTRWDILDIDGLRVESHSQWAGLQFADCVTSAFANGLEPNIYGNYEPRYAHMLRDQLLNDGAENCLNTGLTVVPNMARCKPDASQRAFLDFYRKKGG